MTFYCRHHPDHKPVRGWLFFDYGYYLDHVKFLQHSVLELPDGEILDITPAPGTYEDYPFLRAYESDEDFFAKDKYLDGGNLIHPISRTPLRR